MMNTDLFKTLRCVSGIFVCLLFLSCEKEEITEMTEGSINGQWKEPKSGVVFNLWYSNLEHSGYAYIVEVGTAFPPSALHRTVLRNIHHISADRWSADNYSYYPNQNPDMVFQNTITLVLSSDMKSMMIGSVKYNKISGHSSSQPW